MGTMREDNRVRVVAPFYPSCVTNGVGTCTDTWYGKVLAALETDDSLELDELLKPSTKGGPLVVKEKEPQSCPKTCENQLDREPEQEMRKAAPKAESQPDS